MRCARKLHDGSFGAADVMLRGWRVYWFRFPITSTMSQPVAVAVSCQRALTRDQMLK